MTTCFLDASAIVKRYLTETGSNYVAGLVDQSATNTIVLAEITRVAEKLPSENPNARPNASED